MQHIRLGLLVVVATALLIAGLYFVGQQRNIFRKTATLHAHFKNIDGLMAGNNVRYNGYNVGMVTDVNPINDSLIDVAFSVNESLMHLISVNARAKLITDGLLGNKLVEIEPGYPFDRCIADGDVLEARMQPDMDKAMRTLSETNNNLLAVSADLRSIASRFSSDNSIWQLLSDTHLSPQVKTSISNIDSAAQHIASISRGLDKLVTDVKSGKGSLGAALADTSMYVHLSHTLRNMKMISDTLVPASAHLKRLTDLAVSGKGNMSVLMNDTLISANINSAVVEIENTATSIHEAVELLKQSSFMRRYKRRQKQR